MQTQQNIPLNNIRLPENFRRQMYISYNFDKCISSSDRLVYNTLPLAIQLPITSGRTFLLLPYAYIKYLTWIWLRPVVHIYVAIYLYIYRAIYIYICIKISFNIDIIRTVYVLLTSGWHREVHFIYNDVI